MRKVSTTFAGPSILDLDWAAKSDTFARPGNGRRAGRSEVGVDFQFAFLGAGVLSLGECERRAVRKCEYAVARSRVKA